MTLCRGGRCVIFAAINHSEIEQCKQATDPALLMGVLIGGAILLDDVIHTRAKRPTARVACSTMARMA